LHAGELFIAQPEGGDGFLELHGFGNILRIVDDEKRAPRKRQNKVARFRLCAGKAFGNDNKLEMIGQPQRLGRRQGFLIALLENQFDVELRGRIVQLSQGTRDDGQHAGFAIKRHHHGIDGKLRFGR